MYHFVFFNLTQVKIGSAGTAMVPAGMVLKPAGMVLEPAGMLRIPAGMFWNQLEVSRWNAQNSGCSLMDIRNYISQVLLDN